MLLPIKPICKTDKVRKDGTSVVYIEYCLDSNRRTLLNTGMAVPPKYWHTKRGFISNGIPESCGIVDDLNEQLKLKLRRTEDIISLAYKKRVTDPIGFLNEFFVLDLNLPEIESLLIERESKAVLQNPKLNLDVYFQIDDYIKSKSQRVTPDMLRIYRNMKDHLQAFDEYRGAVTTFLSFDHDYCEPLINFLSLHYIQRSRKEKIIGLKVNTIGKTIKQLRNFLKNRIRKKIITPIDLEDFIIVEEEVDTIYLTCEEINKIYNVDLSGYPHLLDYRNVFVLGCMTGLRFSDF